jgi:hypothetical protein
MVLMVGGMLGGLTLLVVVALLAIYGLIKVSY